MRLTLPTFSARLRALGQDCRGASLIEFALVAPLLGVMTVGIADYSRGFSERFALEAAAHRTLERASVGSMKPDYSFLRQEAATAAGVPLANVMFDNWLECEGVRMSAYDASCTGDQQIARYIYVKIEKDFVPAFNWNGKSKTVKISGDAAVRVQ